MFRPKSLLTPPQSVPSGRSVSLEPESPTAVESNDSKAAGTPEAAPSLSPEQAALDRAWRQRRIPTALSADDDVPPIPGTPTLMKAQPATNPPSTKTSSPTYETDQAPCRGTPRHHPLLTGDNINARVRLAAEVEYNRIIDRCDAQIPHAFLAVSLCKSRICTWDVTTGEKLMYLRSELQRLQTTADALLLIPNTPHLLGRTIFRRDRLLDVVTFYLQELREGVAWGNAYQWGRLPPEELLLLEKEKAKQQECRKWIDQGGPTSITPPFDFNDPPPTFTPPAPLKSDEVQNLNPGVVGFQRSLSGLAVVDTARMSSSPNTAKGESLSEKVVDTSMTAKNKAVHNLNPRAFGFQVSLSGVTVVDTALTPSNLETARIESSPEKAVDAATAPMPSTPGMVRAGCSPSVTSAASPTPALVSHCVPTPRKIQIDTPFEWQLVPTSQQCEDNSTDADTSPRSHKMQTLIGWGNNKKARRERWRKIHAEILEFHGNKEGDQTAKEQRLSL